MRKKQLLLGAMGLMIAGVLAMPVHAENMTVTYREPNTYTITIPQNVDLKTTAQTQVGVSDVNLEPNKSITFAITDGVDDNGVVELSRTDDTTTKAVTTVSTTEGSTGIAKDAKFAEFTANGTQDLYFTAVTAQAGGPVKAGTYTGTLTFTVEAPEKN